MLDKYKYTEPEQKRLLASIIILVDTQEKVNGHITDYFDKHKISYKRRSLESGDYSFMLPQNDELSINRDICFDKDIFVERKNSATELAGNLSQTRSRFESEFLRISGAKKYLLLEDANYFDIVNGNYGTKYSAKSFLGSIHSFNHKYGLEVVYMPDKNYSPIWLYGTFQYYLRNLIK